MTEKKNICGCGCFPGKKKEAKKTTKVETEKIAKKAPKKSK